MCVARQLIGAAPACACLAGCEAGWIWEPFTGQCLPFPTDAGVADSGVPFDAGVPMSDPFTAATAASALATAVCQHRTRCEPALHSFLVQTEAQCITDETTANSAVYDAYVTMIAAGRLGYSQTAFNACVAGLAAADCHQGLAPGVCEDIFTGAQPVGQPCYFNGECTADAYCASGGGLGSCGVCAARALAAGDCASALCVRGTRCLDLTDGSRACVPDTVPLGGACNTVATGVCNGRMQCVGAATPTCQLPAGNGQACDPMLATGPACNIYEAQRCFNNVCTMTRFNAPGQSCADPDGCNSQGECNTVTNLCVAYPAAGQGCLNMTCADGNYCDGTFCQSQQGIGGMCTGAGQCQTNLFCTNGTCQSLVWSQCN